MFEGDHKYKYKYQYSCHLDEEKSPGREVCTPSPQHLRPGPGQEHLSPSGGNTELPIHHQIDISLSAFFHLKRLYASVNEYDGVKSLRGCSPTEPGSKPEETR